MNHKEICDLVAEGYDNKTGEYLELEYHFSSHEEFDFITVRGTEVSKMISGGGWRDTFRDLLIVPWHSHATGWAHMGFLKGAQGIFNRLKFKVKKPLILSGHSLGGGVSLLLAQIFSYHGFEVLEWVGFGTPKAFIGERDLNFPTYSYRHGDDPVTQSPPGIIIKYKHPEPLIQLEDLSDGGGIPIINDEDHTIEIYQKALNART
jgi:hypothetical protein